MKFRHARWGDNDRYFGPFTYSPRNAYTSLAVVLSSGGEGDDSDSPCNLRVCAFGYAFIISLPQIVPVHKVKVFPESWDAATVARLGRNYYWDVTPREYGFVYADGHLNVKLGRQTMDSSTTQDWGCFLPWTQWRHVRRSLYDREGAHFWTFPERTGRLGSAAFHEAWELEKAAKDSCPTWTFDFLDFDKQPLSAKVRVEEREWRFGIGWFKWLSWFRKPKIARCIEIEFSGEAGKGKGSWKGGTIGTSRELFHGETVEGAFRHYCAQHDMTFVGEQPAAPIIHHPV